MLHETIARIVDAASDAWRHRDGESAFDGDIGPIAQHAFERAAAESAPADTQRGVGVMHRFPDST
jgi:hypothetical protein